MSTPTSNNCLPKIFDQLENILAEAQPAYLNITINRIHDEIEIVDENSLSSVIGSLLSLFVSGRRSDATAEQTSCSLGAESFADIMSGLVDVQASFEGEGQHSFRDLLLCAVQTVFEKRIEHMKIAEKQAPELYPRCLDDVVSLVSLVGFLFMRKFFAGAVISHVVQVLLRTGEGQPDTSVVLGVCDLLQHVGPVFDADAKSSTRLSKLFGLLVTTADQQCYSAEVRDAVTALNDARCQGWQSKYETQMLLQCEDATVEDAAQQWTELKSAGKLTLEQMKMEAAEVTESAGRAVCVTNMISGCVMAVLFYATDEEVKEEQLKADIAKATSINSCRLAVF